MQQFKDIQAELQNLQNCLTTLKTNTDHLTSSLTNVQQFTNEIQRDIKKWKFKTEPRLNRIQIILDVLKIDAKNNK